MCEGDAGAGVVVVRPGSVTGVLGGESEFVGEQREGEKGAVKAGRG